MPKIPKPPDPFKINIGNNIVKKKLIDELPSFNQHDLSALLCACGYAIRQKTSLFEALLELGNDVCYSYEDEIFFSDYFETVEKDIDLVILASGCCYNLMIKVTN